MSKRYHTLLVREDVVRRWQFHFGDYDRNVVVQERDDITEHDYLKKNTKIITTGDDQKDIDAAINKLNQEYLE